MASIQKEISIAASPAAVFAFIADPTKLPAVWPSLVEVHDVTTNDIGGSDFAWSYKMAGFTFDGSSTTTEFAPPDRLVSAGKGGIASVIAWSLTPDGGGTRLAVNADYTIPGKLLGKLAEPLIMRENAKEMDVILAGIKAAVEG